jgi:YD repeat-containing protein
MWTRTVFQIVRPDPADIKTAPEPKRKHIAAIAAISSLSLFVTTGALAQSDPVFDTAGFQQTHDYFTQQPGEHIDIGTGSLIVTFTDLTLPGNAGHDLQFQRTFNNKTSSWTYGLAGMVMSVADTWPPPPPALNDPYQSRLRPVLKGADGSHVSTNLLSSDASCPDVNQCRWVATNQFWYYDRQERKLYLPDGTISQYDGSGRLQSSVDPFERFVQLDWNDNTREVTVRQFPGSSQERDVVIDLRPNSTIGYNADSYEPVRMTFNGRQWIYSGMTADSAALLGVTGPTGLTWTYDYALIPGVDFSTEQFGVNTPSGGRTLYISRTLHFQPTVPIADWIATPTLIRKTVSGRGIENGTWQFRYRAQEDLDNWSQAWADRSITSPSGTQTWFAHDQGPDVGYTKRLVDTEEEDRQFYSFLTIGYPHPLQGAAASAAPQQTIIKRDGATYQTDYVYHDVNYHDYHRPYKVVETGTAGSRTTERVFDYAFNADATSGQPYFIGKVLSETVSSDGGSFAKSWAFDHATGFIGSQTEYGIQTTFAPDASGNVASATKANGHTTRFDYLWGVVSTIKTPMYEVDREIYPEGLVKSETRGGRTTKFEYDDLFRIRYTTPPGSNSNVIETRYDDTAGTVTVLRGSTQTVTTLDGFGRSIATDTSADIHTRTRYDAEGRKIHEGYPFGANQPNEVGTDIVYDALGRVRQRTNPDGTYISYAYGPGTVTITDENNHGSDGHSAVQTHEAFGNPDETRLAGVKDANDTQWHYGYNAIGKLTSVTGPPGPQQETIARTWTYIPGTALLQDETHPESGKVTYTDYDPAGNLRQKRDAQGTTFTIAYDDNDRVKRVDAGNRATTTTYENGTDNRDTVAVSDPQATISTSFRYDDAGRLSLRTDTIANHSFTRIFNYDGNDNLQRITYPAGRRVRYDYSNDRIDRVVDESGSRDVASGFAYYPSGAVVSFTSGNGLQNLMAFDPRRYWITAIDASDMHLNYDNYDAVGDVQTLTDRTHPDLTQTLSYDRLDRLVRASSGAAVFQYGYDAHGNRVSDGTQTYAYDPGTFHLVSRGSFSYSYDSNGNLKTAGGALFDYTPDNMLASARNAGGPSTTYAYDGDGWRIVRSANGVDTYFLRGAHGELLAEWSSQASSNVRDYIYAGTRLLASIVTAAPLPGLSSTPSNPPSNPPANPCATFQLSTTLLQFPRNGGPQTLGVTAGYGCFWTVLNKPDWLHSSDTGAGGGSFQIFADPNSNDQPRTVVIVVAGINLTVTQDGGVPGALYAGDELHAGESLRSPNGRYRLELTSDGNLVVWENDPCPVTLWHSHTSGHPGAYALMQADGNFVLIPVSGSAIGISNTPQYSGAHLLMQDDGNLVLYSADGGAPWATGTNQPQFASGDKMHAGERLSSITSPEGAYRFEHKCDGTVWLYRVADGFKLWPNDFSISGTGPATLNNGIFAVFDQYEQPQTMLYGDGVYGHPGAWLWMQSDGNLVMYDADGSYLWDTGTVQYPVVSGYELHVGQGFDALTSANGKYRLSHNSDGTLTLVRLEDNMLFWPGDHPIVAAGPAVLVYDGRLIMFNRYQARRQEAWQAYGGSHPNDWLGVQDDGNVVVYDPSGGIVWTTNTVDFPVATGDTINRGERIETLTSANGRYQLRHGADTRLLLVRTDTGRELWPDEDEGALGGGPAVMDGDGDLVVYDRWAVPRTERWRARVGGLGAVRMTVSDNGSLVWYDASGRDVWHTDVLDYPFGTGDRLLDGQQLGTLLSDNGRVTLMRQDDGNVVMYDNRWPDADPHHVVWASNTVGMPPDGYAIQEGGRFDVRTHDQIFRQYPGGDAPGGAGSYTVVQSDGNLVMHTASGAIRWASGTHVYDAPTAVYGCTDPSAINFTPWATVNDGSCQYPSAPVYGCTDPGATNFNPAATINDGSCQYPPPPPPPHDCGGDTLCGDQYLSQIVSSDGHFELDFQGDGNVVMYDDWGGGAIWASNTVDQAAVAVMQGDGNFVLYDGDGNPVRWSGTNGNGGAYLQLQNDGNLVIYAADGHPLWDRWGHVLYQ